jgi:hypothetical protein
MRVKITFQLLLFRINFLKILNSGRNNSYVWMITRGNTLSAYYIIGTVLNVGDTEVNRVSHVLVLMEAKW